MKKILPIHLLVCFLVASTIIYSCSKKGGTSTPPPTNACNGTAGPLFTVVKQVIESNCTTCHNSANANGGMNFTVNCNIINNKGRIEARAINGTPTPMPQGGLMPQSERDKISAWLAAGGRITD